MICVKTIWLSLLLYCVFPRLATSQTLGELTFRDVVSRFEEHRAQLLSYAAQVEFALYSEDTFDDYVHRSVSLRRFDVLADLTRDSYLMTRNTYRFFAEPKTADTSKILLKNGPRVFIGERSGLVEKNLISDLDGFFDPQVIGVGFCAELRRFYEFEQVIGNYRNWRSDDWEADPADGLVTFGKKLANGSYRERYCFSESQGYSPVLLENKDFGLKVQCTYIQLDGIWLPRICRYECDASRGMVVTIDWIAVNKPLSRELFEIETVRELLGTMSREE